MGYIQYKKPSVTNIEIFGYGELHPKLDNLNDDSRRMNRRVEIKIEEAEKTSTQTQPDPKSQASSQSQGAGLTGAFDSSDSNEGAKRDNDDKPIDKDESVVNDNPIDWNDFLKKYNWIILLIGIVASIFSIIDIIRKWNK